MLFQTRVQNHFQNFWQDVEIELIFETSMQLINRFFTRCKNGKTK